MPFKVIIGFVIFLLIIISISLFAYYKYSGDTTQPASDTSAPISSNTSPSTSSTTTNPPVSSPTTTVPQDTSISDPPPPISSVTPTTSRTPEPPQPTYTNAGTSAPDCSDPVSYYYYYAPDVKAAGVDAQAHWTASGYKEGRKSCWPAPPTNMLDSSGKTAPAVLGNNGQLKSANGKFTVVMQGDGNLVGYKADGKAFWAKGYQSNPKQPYQLVMQGDGNLVVIDSTGKPTWSAGKNGNIPPYRFIVQDDRNLVVYDGNNKPLWASGSNE